MPISPSSTQAVRVYLNAIRSYLRCPEARPDLYSGAGPPRVRTEATDQATVLSKTRVPIRGLEGARVTVRHDEGAGRQPPTIGALLSTVVSYSTSSPKSGAPCFSECTELHRGFETLWDALYADTNLALRILDGVGYKTHDLPELQAQVKNGWRAKNMPFAEFVFLGELVRGSLDSIGSIASKPEDFDDWGALETQLLAQLSELQARDRHSYVATAYLNGPLCDFSGQSVLAPAVDDSTGPLAIRQATDEDLTNAIEGVGYAAHLPPGLESCNTILQFPLRVPVLAPAVNFELRYPRAADLVARAVDVLRVVSGCDIGVSLLRIDTHELSAPTIRETYHERFSPSLGPYLPRRAAFGAPSLPPLDEAGLASVASLISHHLVNRQIQGFTVAVQRFRDAWERHWPTSAERLLDIAIALEAIFLNDGEDKELRFRLALRAARFLEPPGAARGSIFDAVRSLYDLRSKIAHGGDLSQSGKLDLAMKTAPLILRRSLERMLKGDGPDSLQGESLKAWWRQVELS